MTTTGAIDARHAGMNAPEVVPGPAVLREEYFHELAAAIDRMLVPGEFYTAGLAAEQSDFVRFNRGKVRQPGSVAQGYLELDLGRGHRHASHRLTLCGHAARDGAAIAEALATLRAVLPVLDDDPHLLRPDTVRSTHSGHGGALPPAEVIVDAVLDAARGHDLVGIYAGGPVVRGFANAAGQRNWHATTSFNLQWSLYHRADKAVKASLSGLAWNAAAIATRMEEAEAQLALVARPARTLDPGEHRVFLTPAAMEEIAGILQWGAFSARALATRQSALSRMQDADGPRLHPQVSIDEATADGVAPLFQDAGFIRPDAVPLIRSGQLVGSLVSPRTAREFGGETNGANAEESPEAFAMAGGNLAMADALAALDTGLYVSNLWYLNYSDRPACRITGMTRFATFWVENGTIVAPVDVLRFDDTLFRMLGDNLEALTRETELRLESSTYGQRALASMRVPGALVRGISFTL